MKHDGYGQQDWESIGYEVGNDYRDIDPDFSDVDCRRLGERCCLSKEIDNIRSKLIKLESKGEKDGNK